MRGERASAPSFSLTQFAGSEPNSSLVDERDITLDDRGYIIVNERMETSAADVFAGGDVVAFPLNGQRVSIGHWQTSQSHGRAAALTLLGRPGKLNIVPYFWSSFFGKNLRFAGHAKSADNLLIDGDLDSLTLAAYFFEEGFVSAVAAYGRDDVVALFASVSKFGGRVSEESVRADAGAWMRQHTRQTS